MKHSIAKLTKKLREGNVRALAQVISLIENERQSARECIEKLYPHTGSAYVLGVTGAPGAGKSTLVDSLIRTLAAGGKKVAVLAVDPSSPFSGGALLGDRIRMSRGAENEGVFIRSMASRGALGGLAPRTAEAIFALDAAGFDWIIVETVGVGQGEVEIVRHCDTVALVLVPGMGDAVQALKAGIIEIADIFAVNKADHEGVNELERALISVMSLGKKGERRPKIVRCVATKDEGTGELLDAVEEHRQWAKGSGAAEERKRSFLTEALRGQLSDQLLNETFKFAQKNKLLEPAIAKIVERKEDPSSAAQGIIKKFLNQR